MSRLLAILLGAVAIVGAVVLVTSRGGDKKTAKEYRVILDNAAGLTKGTDFRAAGVKVGAVDSLQLDAKTARVVATVSVSRPEFGGLRQNASCTIKPQSLIGEYFMDCDPGTSPQKLPYGGTVPISRTSGTIAPDLVMNILRKPYREKLSVILTELGAGFAARGGDVNETIRRAIPALRDTDSVLRILSDERQTLAQLTRDASTVVGRLNGNRTNVARFVSEARDTAQISARRRTELAGTIRRLPTFQRVLRPTLRDLGVAAERQTPALRDLRIAAPSLTGLLNSLGPFTAASTPAVTALGRASVTGTSAVQDARGTVQRLRKVAAVTKEPLTNLRFILEHIDDRRFAVEKNPLSPGGAGFTGLEAVMQYFFTQSQAINLFDANSYKLKLNALVNECSNYTDGSHALADPARTKRCAGSIGPNGKIEPNPTAASTRARAATRAKADRTPGRSTPAPAAGTQAPAASPSAPSAPAAPGQATPALPDVGKVPVPATPAPGVPSAPAGASQLLDYLLGG